MRKIGVLLVAVVITTAFLSGCRKKEESKKTTELSDEVVAKVGNKEITGQQLRETVRRYSSNLIQRGQQPPPNMEQNVLNLLIESEILYQAGLKMSVPNLAAEVERHYQEILRQFPSPEIMEQTLRQQGLSQEMLREDIKRQVVVDHVIQTEIYSKIEIGDKEIEEFYRDSRDQLHRPEMLHVRHILASVAPPGGDEEIAAAREKIAEIRRRIEAGESFDKLATEYSDCPSKASGGDLGLVPRGQTEPNFEAAAWSLESGQLSEPVETAFGFHLIRVDEKIEEGVPALDAAREDIRAIITRRRVPEKVREYIDRLKQEIKVERFFPG